MKRNIALVDKYPNGYRDKIAYHREQGNDEKVKYFKEKQRQLDENNCIQVLEFMGYENRGKYGTETLVQKGKYNVAIVSSVVVNAVNHLEVLTKLAGKIHKVDNEELGFRQVYCAQQYRALIDTDHNQLKSLLYCYIDMDKQDFIDEVCRIINSEKLIY